MSTPTTDTSTTDSPAPSLLDSMDLTTTAPPPEFSLDAELPPLWIKPGGKVCVGGTRVGYEIVVYHYNQGETAEQIAENYEVLKLADVYGAIAFYLRHREAVDKYLERSDRETNALQAEIQAQYPKRLTREELMKRFEAKKREAQEATSKASAVANHA